MLILLLVAFVSAVSVESIDWTKSSAGEVVYTIAHNEDSSYFYSFILHYGTSTTNSISIDCIHQTSTRKTFTVTTSQPYRPVIAAGTELLFFLNNKNFECYNYTTDPPVFVTRQTDSSVDQYSPIAVIDREFYSGRRETYVFACRNEHIAVYSTSFVLVKETGFPCGKYMDTGYNYLAVKNTSMVEVYSISSGGSLALYTWFSIADTNTSLYERDPLIVNKHDVIYNVISDKNRIQVNSPNSYGTSYFIDNVFFNGNLSSTSPVDTLYSSPVSTYGSFLIVGLMGYTSSAGERLGGVQVIFDSYMTSTSLTSSSSRFTTVYKSLGSTAYNYMGYSVGMNYGYIFVGGKSDVLTNGSLTSVAVDVSKNISKYCIGVSCDCAPGYYYSTYYRKCFTQVTQTTAIIVSVCVFVLFVLILCIVGVLLAYFSKSKPKPVHVDDDDGDEPIVYSE
ncbi:Serine/threonine protein kinase [Entamoeba marina]